MNQPFRHAALAWLVACAPLSQAADSRSMVLASFAYTWGYVQASLSPDGSRVALLSTNPGPEVVIVDLDTLKSWGLAPKTFETPDPKHPLAKLTWALVPSGVRWVDDDDVAVDFVRRPSWHVRVSGKKSFYQWSYEGRYLGTARFSDTARREALVWDPLSKSIERKAAGDSPPQPLQLGLPGDARPLSLRQDRDGVIRIAITQAATPAAAPTRIQTWYRSDDGAPWIAVDERGVNDEPFDAVDVTAKADQILVVSRNGGDRAAVWRYDVKRHAFMEQVFASPDADVTLVERASDIDGIAAVRTEGLTSETIWLDERLRKLQAAVDAVLPDHVNVLHPGASRRMLVESSSDVEPGKLYALDTRTMKMQFVADRRANTMLGKMQPMRKLRYPAADGLQVPAYLTLPGHPTAPAPLIVLVHGGPQQRDHWAWNEEVQVYASQGYAVFQPQFRGSSGFGKHHEEAGYGQWGQAMEDDITDGVKWLADQHLVDPKRICIIGASYGGYAALWGLVKTPDLYKCGVSVAGVSDLEAELTTDSEISRSPSSLEIARRRIGDPTLMKAAFDDVSPLKHADRIKAPVLIVHGRRDERVPFSQGERMWQVLAARQAKVEWMPLDDEAHGLSVQLNRHAYYLKVFDLLDETIGPAELP